MKFLKMGRWGGGGGVGGGGGGGTRPPWVSVAPSLLATKHPPKSPF